MWIILSFIILLTSFLIWKLPARRVYFWRRSLNLKRHKQAFNDLYATVNGFLLSRQSRKNGDSLELVYGEIDFESFIALLTLCQPQADTIFYDLGSGTGKAVLACAMVFNVQKSLGIELLPSLYNCSQAQQQRLAALPAYCHQEKTIEFKLGNFLSMPIGDATIVFINSTAFFADHWQKISAHLEDVQPGTYIISTSKVLLSDKFAVRRTTLVKMSWGLAKVFIQQRIA